MVSWSLVLSLGRYGKQHQLTTLQQIGACSSRAFKLHIRDKDNFVIPFTNQSIMQGLVIGSIFWYMLCVCPGMAAVAVVLCC
jgi:hypothetical protein